MKKRHAVYDLGVGGTHVSIFGVNTVADALALNSANPFADGDAVRINRSQGGSVANPFLKTTTYYAREASATSIHLYDTSAHAIAGGATGLFDMQGGGMGGALVTSVGASNSVDLGSMTAAVFFVETNSADEEADPATFKFEASPDGEDGTYRVCSDVAVVQAESTREAHPINWDFNTSFGNYYMAGAIICPRFMRLKSLTGPAPISVQVDAQRFIE